MAGIIYCVRNKIFDGKGCPVLVFKNGRYWCQLVLDHPEIFKEGLAIGTGCSSALNTWRKDVKYRG